MSTCPGKVLGGHAQTVCSWQGEKGNIKLRWPVVPDEIKHTQKRTKERMEGLPMEGRVLGDFYLLLYIIFYISYIIPFSVFFTFSTMIIIIFPL